MKRSHLATVGALALVLLALLLVLPNTAQVGHSIAAEVDAATAARFVNTYPDQYANFFVEQADSKVAYCIDKEALYAFREFEKTSSLMSSAPSNPTAEKGAARPLRIGSLEAIKAEEADNAKATDEKTAQEAVGMETTEATEETPLEAVDRQITELEVRVNALPPEVDSPMRDELETLKAHRAKLQSKN